MYYNFANCQKIGKTTTPRLKFKNIFFLFLIFFISFQIFISGKNKQISPYSPTQYLQKAAMLLYASSTYSFNLPEALAILNEGLTFYPNNSLLLQQKNKLLAMSKLETPEKLIITTQTQPIDLSITDSNYKPTFQRHSLFNQLSGVNSDSFGYIKLSENTKTGGF